MSAKDWVNSINTVSFSSLVNQGLWTVGSLAFTGVACWLLTRSDGFNDVGVLIRSGSGMRGIGYDLAAALLFAWTGKSAISAAARYGKSKTSEKYVKAKAEGQAAAAKATTPAVHADKVETVEVNERDAKG